MQVRVEAYEETHPFEWRIAVDVTQNTLRKGENFQTGALIGRKKNYLSYPYESSGPFPWQRNSQ